MLDLNDRKIKILGEYKNSLFLCYNILYEEKYLICLNDNESQIL